MKKNTHNKGANKHLQASEEADIKRSVDAAERIVKSIIKQDSGTQPSSGQSVRLFVPEPPKNPSLVTKRGNSVALTPSGIWQQVRIQNHPDRRRRTIVSAFRLQLDSALNPSGRGVAIDRLVPLAANEVEQKMFSLIHGINPALFAEYDDPLKALLHLRLLYIPRICRRLLNNEIKKNEAEILWLGGLSAYSVAFERTLFERLYRAAYKSRFISNSEEEMQKWASTELGGTIFMWFEKTDEGHKYWLSRFDQWLDYALRSLDHYLGSQSIDYREKKGDLKRAAHLGILKLLNALPGRYIVDVLNDVKANTEMRKMFDKNARKRPTTPRHLDFHSWLIECWPLVLEYHWNYRDIQRVATKRFDDPSVQIMIDNPRELRKLCNKLHLRIGPTGSSRIGRPKQNEDSYLPPMTTLALRIDGLQDSEWFFGKTEAGLKTTQ